MSDRHKAIKLWNELTAEWKGKPAKDLSRGYWVSEWSWSPLCDGIFPSFHEKIPYFKFIDGLCFYVSGTNYRVYAQWDLCSTEQECQELCSKKNSCGYEWDTLYREKLKELGLKIEPYREKECGWFSQKPPDLSPLANAILNSERITPGIGKTSDVPDGSVLI